jgi:Uma2 family endonuclease
MATVLKLGRADHGRPMTLEEYFAGDYEEGNQYELIDGRLYVSPTPNAPYDLLDQWLYHMVDRYADEHSEIINYVTNKGRIFVPDRPGETSPEPDLTAFRNYPLHLPARRVTWRNLSPLLVAEILSADDPDKDLVRNVELYVQVPTIREYWIVDPREDFDRPRLLVYRRRGRQWQRLITVEPGETYTTRLLPGFELVLDRRA